MASVFIFIGKFCFSAKGTLLYTDTKDEVLNLFDKTKKGQR